MITRGNMIKANAVQTIETSLAHENIGETLILQRTSFVILRTCRNLRHGAFHPVKIYPQCHSVVENNCILPCQVKELNDCIDLMYT
jgi:hypothetical protein